MKSIRYKVFETNSSSTHAICITKNNILDQKVDCVNFTIGEFGWEVKTYNSTYDKAKYLYTSILCNNMDDLIQKIKNILDIYEIKYKFEEPVYDDEYNYLKNGYIDHYNELDNFLEICHDEDKLMKYLFSSQSFVVTGNDNSNGSYAKINIKYEHDEYFKGN